MAKFVGVLIYKIKAKALQPLHIGSSEGDMNILTDSIYKKPYIQANSLAGAFGEYADEHMDAERKAELFGSVSAGKSKIVFSNGEILKNKEIELRPRVKINQDYGIVSNKFEVQLLSPGADLEFTISVFENEKINDDGTAAREDYAETAEMLVSAFNDGKILLGGQKTNGCGKFEVTYLGFKKFNLYDKKDCEAWLNSDIEFEDVTDKVLKHTESDCYNISMRADIMETLIVKSTATFSSNNVNKFVNSESIKNSAGDYFVPGSSIKGVLKGRIYSIGEYMKLNKNILDEMFGAEAEISNTDTGIAGKVMFEDAIIDKSRARVIHRVKIDKFTGGAYGGGKFDEMPVAGVLTITVRVPKKMVNSCAAAALVMMALRDLGCGVISLGGLSSVGRGFIEADALNIDNEDERKIFRQGMNRLKELVEQIGGV